MKTDIKMRAAFRALERTLHQNIANDIIQYTFHKNATDEELVAFYGGGYASREKLLEDTIRHLTGDQMVLRFLLSNKKEIYEYATKDPTGDLGITLKRAAGIGTEPDSIGTNAAPDGAERHTDQDLRPGADGSKSDNSASAPRGNGEGSDLGEAATLGVPNNAGDSNEKDGR